MDFLARSVIKYRKAIVAVFLILSVICAALTLMVGVNYNMVDYLPEDAQSTKALAIMNSEFTQALPNLSVMVRDVSVAEAMDSKAQIAGVEGVADVIWLDSMVDLRMPLESHDAATVEGFYKNSNAMFSVSVEEGYEVSVCAEIRGLFGEAVALSGEASDTNDMQSATGSEVMSAMFILVPLIILVLVLSTSSWIEPLLFLSAIGVSVILNMGTNLIFGEVSFLTNSVSPILQLAVSLDYAIFLLHRFEENCEKYESPEDAMYHAIRAAISTVASSAVTTLFGFLALVVMDFKIGADLGLSLAKGIVLSFVSVVVFLPALTLCLNRLIAKCKHREFLPSFANVNRYLSKLAVPVVCLVLIAVIPAFLGQGKTDFIYGSAMTDPELRSYQEKMALEEQFGASTVMAIIVPRGDVAREKLLSDRLLELEHVTGVMSYAGTVGTSIPPEYLSADVVGQFYSENYARIIAYTDTEQEGALAFAVVTEIQAVCEEIYPGEVYSLGQSASLLDMKNVVTRDNTRVTIVAVIAIFLTLLVTFRSAVLPFVLLLTIETAIWINMAIPYFIGSSINFIGYLVLNSVQLGATVDYAILLTDRYLFLRRKLPKKEAMHKALGSSFKSILISALTLSVAGFTLYFTSTNPSVCDIGMLLGRGTLISFAMVVLFLPAMLRLFDAPIGKLTYKSNFYKSDAQAELKEPV